MFVCEGLGIGSGVAFAGSRLLRVLGVLGVHLRASRHGGPFESKPLRSRSISLCMCVCAHMLFLFMWKFPTVEGPPAKIPLLLGTP